MSWVSCMCSHLRTSGICLRGIGHCTGAEGTVMKTNGVPAFGSRSAKEKRSQILLGIEESFLEEATFGLKSFLKIYF